MNARERRRGCLPDELPVPDVALRLRCSACGSKRIVVTRLNMLEAYKSMSGVGRSAGC